MVNFNFISVRVKCPVCDKSLMDAANKIDNEDGIRLLVKTGSQQGTIWLSSIYGSYNYLADVNILDNEIASFYCPHCKSDFATHDYCGSCNAHMIGMLLEMGGKISFCSRKGCQNHNIGFDDLGSALTQLYQDYGYRGKKIQDDLPISRNKPHDDSVEQENKEIIESGAFLQSFCPHCRKSLIENGMLKLKVKNEQKAEGYALLSPYLNVFSLKSTIYLPEHIPLTGIMCPHCDKSLIEEGEICQRCGTEVARIMVSARTKMITFYICAKKGCTWHGLNKQDMDDIRLEDSIEW